MVRGIISFGGLAVVLLAAFSIILQRTGTVDCVGLLFPLEEIDESFQRGFRSDAIAKINRIRLAGELEGLRVDEEIQGRLTQFVDSHSDPTEIDLQRVFDDLQGTFPGAQYLAANLVTSGSREDLLSKIGAWDAVVSSEFNVINTVVFTSGRTIGALGVMSRRISQFSLGAANRVGGKFFNRCPHCDEVHALEVEKESRTLILSCPYCDRPFDVLASDTSGRIRRASDFFEDFQLPENDAGKALQSSEGRIVSLWSRIAERCEYEMDQEYFEAREVWKSSNETWAERAGDCEDTSILLADVLISAGFDARVAIGWNGNIGQHAWVVVRVGDKQYVLESTFQQEISAESLVDLAEAADFYQPEQLFDRENLYFSSA
ncbi:MAG: transglutaminase-like domain-containing protein, partial [Verrucomicrobiales bacterium]